ncbi:MAG: hypothetical protein ACXWTH_07550 [Methylosarcina sp.]
MKKEILLKIFTNIGYVLLDIQSTEKAIKLCVKVVLPYKDELLTTLSERLLNNKYDKNTVGQMLSALRERATFQADFEDILKRFLKNINILAHDVTQAPGWNLKDKQGVIASNKFLIDLLEDSKTVRLVFVGIINSWRVQSGHQVSDEEMSKYEIPDSLARPIIKDIYKINA